MPLNEHHQQDYRSEYGDGIKMFAFPVHQLPDCILNESAQFTFAPLLTSSE